MSNQTFTQVFGSWRRKVALALFIIVMLGAPLFYIASLNHVTINEIGVAYDSLNGEVWQQVDPGWYVTSPFTRVTYANMLPFKVTIPSDARVINTKIVRFNPDGLEEYIRLQGWEYTMENSMENAFLGYAFSGQEFPFMIVVQEAGEEQYGNLRPGPLGKSL